jgi:hypothetical protein
MTNRCARFIASLAGLAVMGPPISEESSVIEETAAKTLFIPAGVIVRGGIGFFATIVNLVDISQPYYRDDKAMILDPDSSSSLHQETIEELASWRPLPRHLRRAQNKEEDL